MMKPTTTPPIKATNSVFLSEGRCGYCYVVKNKSNGMMYIGKRQQPKFDPNYLGSGIYVKRAVAKYGKRSFTVDILQWAYAPLELDLLEIMCISFYREMYGSSRLYNIANGGEGGCGQLTKEHKKKLRNANLGKKASEETRKKLSIAASLAIRPPCSEETKEKIRIGNTGKRLSVATRKKLSFLRKGQPSHRKGKTLSLETRLKMSASRTGLKYSDKVRAKRSIAVKRSWEKRPRVMSQEQKNKISISLRANRSKNLDLRT